jgi:L-alanine-DL-glutamate epimerase-like enolase superfamily enzyme
MKITDVRPTIVAVPLKTAYKSTWRRSYIGATPMVAVLVEIETDDGIVGIGETPVVVGHDANVTVDVINAVEFLLLGQDPLQVEILKREMYSHCGLPHLGVRGLGWALSGIDIALWDIVGKTAGLPLHKMWGGPFRTQIPFYADLPPDTPDRMAASAKQWVEEGFRTVYIKVGFDPDLDVSRVAAVREAIGRGSIRLRVDANQAWSPGMAKHVIRRMAPYDLEYVEQPVQMYNLDDLAEVRRAVSVPILAHESTYTFYDALNVVKHQAADALQLDPRFDAGLLGARLAAGIAEAAGLPVVTHTFGELGVATAAFMQLIAACPNFILDNQTYYWNLVDDVIKDGLMAFRNGALALPPGPGIGVGLDSDRVQKYAELYQRELAGKPIERPADTYYDRRYLLFPRY